MNTNTKGYAVDKIDERDFEVGILVGKVEKLPEKIFLKDGEIQDQSLEESTKYGCVFYTGSTISNTMNFLNKEKTRITGEFFCDEAEKKGLLDREEGAYVVSSPKLLKELGYIEGYARARSLYDVKLSLFHKKPVQTGSNLIDWRKTRSNDNIVVKGNSYGHSFVICGYDDGREVLICENSYGEDKFDNGYFYIQYSDFNLLFESKYMMTDKIQDIPNNRYWKFLKKHIQSGYTPIFEDYSEEGVLNAGEVKVLIDLGRVKNSSQ